MSDLPYPNEPDRTHWEGCYRSAKHHNCAVEEVDRLRRQLDTAREALRPFASDAERWYDFPDAQTCVEDWPDGPDPSSEITVGDLRRARRTLAVLDGEDKADG